MEFVGYAEDTGITLQRMRSDRQVSKRYFKWVSWLGYYDFLLIKLRTRRLIRWLLCGAVKK